MLVVKAIHTFVAEHGDELEFQAGEEIVVLEKDEAFGDGWWRVSLSRVMFGHVARSRGCTQRRPLLTALGKEYKRRRRLIPGHIHR